MIDAALDYAAQIATIVALAFSFNGYFQERRKRANLERKIALKSWSNIARIRSLMTDLEKPATADGFDFGKHQAVGKLTSMYRDGVLDILEQTPQANASHIESWRKSGKICSDWQESCFWECLPLSDATIKEQANQHDCTKFQSLDELPPHHMMAGRHNPQCDTALAEAGRVQQA